MKLFIDIGHPAHVHYFRRFINHLRRNGHEVMVSARDKDVTLKLLDEYRIPYFNRGKGRDSLIGKILYMLKADFLIFRKTRKFAPDAYLSFASPYAAQVAWLRRKPHIAFDDTEHAKIARKFYLPFSKYVYTPKCFELNLGPKHKRFDSFMELAYLHPDVIEQERFDDSIIPSEPYVFIRFVAWTANHDVGQSGLSNEAKRQIVDLLSKKFKLLISAEGDFPEEYSQYKVNFSPSEIHNVLKNAALFVGEGATMAVESAFLGTPSIYVNSLNAGTLKEMEKMGLMKSFRNSAGVIEAIQEVLSEGDSKKKRTERIERIRSMQDPNSVILSAFNVQS